MSRRRTIPIPPFVGFGSVYAKLALPLWERDLCPLPIGANDRPLVKWKTFQTKRMARRSIDGFINRFGDADRVAIPTGPFHNLTVVDVDGDAADIDFAIDRFGDPRVMSETPSFGVHLYYSHSGERSCQRILGRLIDVRGSGGLVFVPGSTWNGELYRFIEGGWNDLNNLTAAEPALYEAANEIQTGREPLNAVVPDGKRDITLYRYARNTFPEFLPIISPSITANETKTLFEKSFIAFSDHLVAWDAQHCDPPKGHKYVRGKARRWWNGVLNGTLYADGQRTIGIPVNENLHRLTRDHSRALGLLMQLRIKYPIGRPFTCTVRRAKDDFAMDGKTLRECLRVLVDLRYVQRLHQGGRYSPAIAKTDPNLPNHGDVAWFTLLHLGVSRAS